MEEGNVGNHPSLVYAQSSDSAWEQQERETYCAEELREEYRQALYTEKGLEIVKQECKERE